MPRSHLELQTQEGTFQKECSRRLKLLLRFAARELAPRPFCGFPEPARLLQASFPLCFPRSHFGLKKVQRLLARMPQPCLSTDSGATWASGSQHVFCQSGERCVWGPVMGSSCTQKGARVTSPKLVSGWSRCSLPWSGPSMLARPEVGDLFISLKHLGLLSLCVCVSLCVLFVCVFFGNSFMET